MTRTPPETLPEEGTMSFGDHLEDLRRRILLAVIPALPLAVGLFFVSDTLIRWLVLPLRRVLVRNDLPAELQQLAPPELLVVEIKLSLIFAAVVLAPWILWQAWQFVRPGLYGHERRFVHFLIPGSTVLTVAGVALLYYVMLPLMLQVLVSVGSGLDLGDPEPDRDGRVAALLAADGAVGLATRAPAEPAPGTMWLLVPDLTLWAAVAAEGGGVEVLEVRKAPDPQIRQVYRVSTYVSFVLVLLLGIVVAFQMPLVIVLMGWMGLATPEFLSSGRRYALFVCGVVAAVITPADVVSMIAMLIPLYGLYELGILLMRVAPASAVAEGRILWRWRSHKRSTDKPATQAVDPVQPASTVPRTPDGADRSGPPD